MDIFTAVLNNDICSVYKFLKYDFNDPNERNDQGLTSLHLCATHGFVEITALFLEFGALLNVKDQESSWTPLHRSLYFGHFEVSWLLIRAGAILDDDVDEFYDKFCIKNKNKTSFDCRDKDGLSPLRLLSTILTSMVSTTISSILTFGKADYQLGVELPNSSSHVISPKRIHTLADELVYQVSANKHHSLVITDEGKVWSWGHGKDGRLGLSDESIHLLPKMIMTIKCKVISVSTGLNHSLALSDTGNIYSWGSNRQGQLGHKMCDDYEIVTEPRILSQLLKEVIKGISAGDFHSVCYSQSGDIYSWGSNKSGQLGLKCSDVNTSSSGIPIVWNPKKVQLFSNYTHYHNKIQSNSKSTEKLKVIELKAAYSSTIVLVSSGDLVKNNTKPPNEVYQWGNGSYLPVRVKFQVQKFTEKLGKSSADNMLMLCDIHVNIIQISLGKYHYVGVSDQGHVYTWGLGNDQLGHQPTDSMNFSCTPPRLVESLLPERGGGKIVYTDATSNRTCAVSEIGELFTWGATNQQVSQ